MWLFHLGRGRGIVGQARLLCAWPTKTAATKYTHICAFQSQRDMLPRILLCDLFSGQWSPFYMVVLSLLFLHYLLSWLLRILVDQTRCVNMSNRALYHFYFISKFHELRSVLCLPQLKVVLGLGALSCRHERSHLLLSTAKLLLLFLSSSSTTSWMEQSINSRGYSHKLQTEWSFPLKRNLSTWN